MYMIYNGIKAAKAFVGWLEVQKNLTKEIAQHTNYEFKAEFSNRKG
jgi:hypothetical protein